MFSTSSPEDTGIRNMSVHPPQLDVNLSTLPYRPAAVLNVADSGPSYKDKMSRTYLISVPVRQLTLEILDTV